MASLPVVLSLLFVVMCPAESQTSVTDTLFTSVMESYTNRNSRYNKPPGMQNGTLNVNVTMFLMDIISVDAYKGIVDLELLPSFSWIDPRLEWDASFFDNTTMLYVPHDMVWRPDIVPYRGTATDGMKEYNAVVYSSGFVAVNPKWNLKTRCSMNNDQRAVSCFLEFGSWTYDANKLSLRLVKDALDLEFNVEGNWEVVTADGRRVEKIYDCCDYPYVTVVYNVTLAFIPK